MFPVCWLTSDWYTTLARATYLYVKCEKTPGKNCSYLRWATTTKREGRRDKGYKAGFVFFIAALTQYARNNWDQLLASQEGCRLMGCGRVLRGAMTRTRFVFVRQQYVGSVWVKLSWHVESFSWSAADDCAGGGGIRRWLWSGWQTLVLAQMVVVRTPDSCF